MLLAAVALAMLAGVAFLLPSAGGSRRAKARRIDRVRNAAVDLRAAAASSPDKLARRERRARFGVLASALQRLLPGPQTLRERFDQAGLNLAPGDALAGGLIGTIIVALVLWTAGLPGAAAPPLAFTLVFGGAAAYVAWLRRRRALKFLSLLPEAIDLVVRAVKSGLPVSEAICLIGEEVADPVGEVFRDVASNMRIGMSTEDALWLATRKVDSPEFRFLVVSIALQRETGGNLAGILSNLGTMVRRREQMKLKVRAMSSEARASAMIIGSLPFCVGGVLLLINPDYIMKLFIDPRGHTLALFGLGSLLTGIGVIARMVRFEI